MIIPSQDQKQLAEWRSHLVCLMFVYAISISTVASAQEPNRYYLGVGVEDYEHETLRKPAPLKYCVEDVTALGEFLKSQGYDVTLMTDDTGKEDAKLAPTKANVDAAIKALLEKGKRGDTVIIALAGHGLQFAGKPEAYFCPADAKPFASKIETLIPASRIYGEMEASFATSKVLLVDACRNDPDPTRGRGFDPGTAPPPKGIAVYFSCDAGQKALENDDLKHGVFFHYVIEGLSGKAKDDDNEVSLNTLANYVSKQVTRKVKAIQPNQPQQPNLRFEQVGESPVLVTVDSVTSWQPALQAGTVQEFTDLKVKFCYCPPGKFLMGDPRGNEGHREDEDSVAGEGGDQVEVTLTKGFWLGQTEVTQKLWFDVMETRPWLKEDGSVQNYVKEGDSIAASYVSYDDAIKFCDKLSERDRAAGLLKGDERFTLPTEAQWEYACRAGTKTVFYFGNDVSQLGEFAWCYQNAYYKDEEYSHQVGIKKPNQWNLYDMYGNCSEWCLDGYQDYLIGGKDPHVKVGNGLFVNRGATWSISPTNYYSSGRKADYRFLQYKSTGFRILRTE